MKERSAFHRFLWRIAPIVKLDIIRLCESLVSGSNPDWGTTLSNISPDEGGQNGD